jgi:chromate transporter
MPQEPPTLWRLFLCFNGIGLQSFGGGLSSWMRREIVQKRGWIADQSFLSGLALSQIAPGANAVNLAVFLGATLRGGAGALAALGGLMLLPMALILTAGALYFSGHGILWVDRALGGLGAAAIGLNLATGLRMVPGGIRSLRQGAVMVGVTVAVGVLGWPLLPVLAAAIPLSLLLEARAAR